jgi:hypothetical protein
MIQTAASALNRSGSSLFPGANNVIPNSPRESALRIEVKPDTPKKEKGPKRLNSSEAIQLAMMLSEQESLYGANMYDSLQPEDDAEIQAMIAQGMSMEEAVLGVFERKFIHPPTGSQGGSQSRSMSEMNLIPNNSNHTIGSKNNNFHMTVSQLSLGSVYSEKPSPSIATAQALPYQQQQPNPNFVPAPYNRMNSTQQPPPPPPPQQHAHYQPVRQNPQHGLPSVPSSHSVYSQSVRRRFFIFHFFL